MQLRSRFCVVPFHSSIAMPLDAGAISSQCRYSVAKGGGLRRSWRGAWLLWMRLWVPHPSLCGVWRVVVAKSTLNSGKSTIDGGFRERFEPLAMDGERIASSSFAFPQFTGLYCLSSQCGISRGSPEWELELPIIVDLPEFALIYPTSRVVSVPANWNRAALLGCCARQQ